MQVRIFFNPFFTPQATFLRFLLTTLHPSRSCVQLRASNVTKLSFSLLHLLPPFPKSTNNIQHTFQCASPKTESSHLSNYRLFKQPHQARSRILQSLRGTICCNQAWLFSARRPPKRKTRLYLYSIKSGRSRGRVQRH